MKPHQEQVSAADFKAKCLQIMDDVEASGKTVVVTKRGRPVAMLVPTVAKEVVQPFGCLKETVTIIGDILAPISVDWNADD